MSKARNSKAVGGTQPTALPSSPKTAAVAPRFPHAAFGRAVEPEMVWVFTFVRRDCGDA